MGTQLNLSVGSKKLMWTVAAIAFLMQLVVAVVFAQSAGAVPLNSGPFSLEADCDANHKAVLNMETTQAISGWVFGNVKYTTDYDVKTHDLSAGDVDVWSVNTGVYNMPAGSASAQVTGLYFNWIFPQFYNQTFTINYDALNCDVQKPNVTIVTPTQASSNPGSFTVEGTASDAKSGVASVTYTVNEITGIGGSHVANGLNGIATGTNSWGFNVSGLTTGYYRVKVVATDNAGNQRQKYNDILVDTTKPSVNVETPVNGANMPEAFTVGGVASDVHTAVSEVKYTVTQIDGLGGNYVATVANGTANGTDSWEFDVSGLTTGYYRLKVQAFDMEGNWRYDYNDVFVDASKPVVQIDTPTNGSILISGDVVVSGVASDAETSVTEVKYTVTQIDSLGGSYVATIASGTAAGTTNWTFGVAGLADGFYRLKVQAFDEAGNWKYSYHDVQIAVPAPLPPVLGGGNASSGNTNGGTSSANSNLLGVAEFFPTNNTASTNGSDNNGDVLGTSTDNDKKSQDKSDKNTSDFSWYWWLIIAVVAAIAAWWFLFGRKRRADDEA